MPLACSLPAPGSPSPSSRTCVCTRTMAPLPCSRSPLARRQWMDRPPAGQRLGRPDRSLVCNIWPFDAAWGVSVDTAVRELLPARRHVPRLARPWRPPTHTTGCPALPCPADAVADAAPEPVCAVAVPLPRLPVLSHQVQAGTPARPLRLLLPACFCRRVGEPAHSLAGLGCSAVPAAAGLEAPAARPSGAPQPLLCCAVGWLTGVVLALLLLPPHLLADPRWHLRQVGVPHIPGQCRLAPRRRGVTADRHQPVSRAGGAASCCWGPGSRGIPGAPSAGLPARPALLADTGPLELLLLPPGCHTQPLLNPRPWGCLSFFLPLLTRSPLPLLQADRAGHAAGDPGGRRHRASSSSKGYRAAGGDATSSGSSRGQHTAANLRRLLMFHCRLLLQWSHRW